MIVEKIDLNCDLGEGYDDASIMPYISSCNIACGGHTGTAATVAQTINLAIEHEVAIGAHPSYPDQENFGRKTMDIPLDTLMDNVCNQIDIVTNLCLTKEARLHHIKPHGALYNDLAQNKTLAKIFLERMQLAYPDTIIYLMAESEAAHLAVKKGIPIKHEAFTDRTYSDRSQLMSRSKEGAVLTESGKVLLQLENLSQGTIIDIHEIKHQITVDTICLHSDTINSVALAAEIFKYLKLKDIVITAH